MNPNDSTPLSAGRRLMLAVLALFFAVAGLGHFLATESLVRIVPDWVPHAREVVLLTGACELAGAVALFIKPLRKAAGIAFALYALCVWPANFKHAFYAIDMPTLPSTWWYHAPRLVLQPVIIWWSLYASGVTSWPWRAKVSER